ncbi:tRNA (adenosine(37)-N6)-threonylcarbamoyltransferase complex ATPase subunit type 1 TsaE [Schaalia hyovaginalis]|uniref:tRNA (adenosine(37)-N6)-threonylcarbamoyltransferase complex ATPase subunit type 1 TsaE n=1 Tax=Schaalia hyovaginalis TaxID=29316 RepID=UPI0012B3CEC0|nr:tRNA (adenosine(37)-N6)-threonylcarbamoyltransferase complex ATPase subunit type 1 TsaE [Schaalia hyovaginalis]MCI6557175.1 tRNA (adenosine(37)-N6)-threonylcarbamoyltransferase complex ATPase subunit type 1 TsaE [Schaalia hyovaginalis]MDD7555075.1 tRNA (adenosine(37)-N6)-threonylcarbamoyltransferase complex ATPase subunit type 1 TsaE [Schaalia hyovaginalis]MDY3094249.1 tRNA (adenosine(37)-N6)-threonylcarbamoyltransferase complex ATPase subunit type 1 TsaE [Schaalia hyovaginalis]MST64052.1 tR
MNAVLSATTRSAEQTRALGRALGEVLRAGDLIMLSGGLGAGKTTLTQGIGEGMGVRGRVASPTFIVARVHPSQVGGPDLIHADAYRISDLEDLETLDLDSSLADSVTVVEWGEGKTEGMSSERLEIAVVRATGGTAGRTGGAIDLESMDDGERRIELRPHGSRWDGVLDRVLVRARGLIAEGEAQALDEGAQAEGVETESVAPAADE